MNFCRRCQSEYENPGTCNCYAEGTQLGKDVVPFPVFPGYPTIPYQTTCGGTTTTTTNTPGTSWYTLPPCDPSAPVHVYGVA